MKLDTLHLEGLKWEIIVVDEPFVNAWCFPGGKIVVFSGLLDHYKTDEEIAIILGHEVCLLHYIYETETCYFIICTCLPL